MPIYDITCQACHYCGEVLVLANTDSLPCPQCGSLQTEKLLSPTSSLTGRETQAMPGPGDTACCGQPPSAASCAGPGACCGKTV